MAQRKAPSRRSHFFPFWLYSRKCMKNLNFLIQEEAGPILPTRDAQVSPKNSCKEPKSGGFDMNAPLNGPGQGSKGSFGGWKKPAPHDLWMPSSCLTINGWQGVRMEAQAFFQDSRWRKIAIGASHGQWIKKH